MMKRLVLCVVAFGIACGLVFADSWDGGGVGRNKFYLNGVGKGAYSILGNYSATVTKFHFVTYSGHTWVCVKNNGSASPQRPSSNSGYWGRWTGTAGPAGPAGPAGSGSGDMLKSENLSGLSNYATARTNLGLVIGNNVQAYDADLTTYAGITPSTNIQTLLGSADYSAARTNLGLAIGTNVQAYNSNLTGINQALTSSSNPSFGTLNLVSANALNLGTSGTNAGEVRFKSGTAANNYYFSILGSNFGANIGWTLPTAAPAGNGYLLTASTTGVLSYTDPSTLGSGASVSDTAYGATTWDGVTTTAPSKNAVRDYLESKLPSGADGSYGITLTNNTAKSPTASANEIYFEANILKGNQNGTESTITIGPTAGQVSFTGPTAARAYALPDSAATLLYSGGALGTPSGGTLTNATGLPVATGISGLGTGIATALAVNTGSAGAPVLFNGAGGTPTSLNLTKAVVNSGTSLPGTCTVGNLFLDTDADTNGQLYSCVATNTWKDVDDDGGAGGMATTDIDTSAELRAILTDEVGTGAAYFVGGALGTPASATLTNATGLPISGLTASTSTALGVGSIELGAASDTTIARSAAGKITVESNPVAYDATLTSTHASPSTTNPLSPTWVGVMHSVWYGATGTINLPAASGYAGRGILIYNTGAFTITIDSNGSEVIVRDGTAQTGGVSMTLSSGAGNYVALLCDGARWVTLGYKGTLAAGS